MKKCTKCGEVKNPSEFRRNKARKDGLTLHCKQCKKAYDTHYFQNNRDKVYDYRKSYRERNKHIAAWRNLLSNTIRALGTTKESNTHSMLNYSALELEAYLSGLGMDWTIHHIDHKVPITWFKQDTPPSLVNDLRNLTPLKAHENRMKGNKVSSPIEKGYYEEVLPWILPKYLKFLLIKEY